MHTEDTLILKKQPGLTFSIECSNPTRWQKLLFACRLLKPVRMFTVKPICMMMIGEISRILAEAGLVADGTDTFSAGTFQTIADKKDTCIKVIAMGIHNRRGEPDKNLIQYLDENLSALDLGLSLQIVVKQLGIANVVESILLVQSINILKTSIMPPKNN